MSPFSEDLYWATIHPTDSTTRELGLKGLGDAIEFGRWDSQEDIQEVVAHLVDRAMEENEDLAILALHTLDKVARYHPRAEGRWNLGHLSGVLQYATPRVQAVARRTLAAFGHPVDTLPDT